MRNKASQFGILLMTLVAGGCYPLEQAPLVYSSKQNMGINVTSGTTDTPGVDIVIGYKGLDIALVPVAVAKYCEVALESDCLDQIYKMQVIAGGRQDPLNSKDLVQRVTELRQSIDEAGRKVENNEEAIKAIEIKLAKQQRLNQLEREIRQAEKDKSLVLTVSPGESASEEQIAQANEIDIQIAKRQKELDAYSSISAAEAEAEGARAGKLRAKNIELEAGIRKDRETLIGLEQQLQSAKAGSRADALSVYGTFTGNANGQAQQAGLSVGKVFATGVAAQYLAERAGTANCLASVAVLAARIKDDDAARNALISQAGELCIHREADS